MNADTATTKLSELGQIALTMRDVEGATAFYRDTLGLPHLFSAPPGLSFFACGNIRLMLSRPEPPEAEPRNSVLYFKVGDIQQARDALAQRGVVFESEPHLIARMPDHELWMAFFRDPEKNLLALMCEKRPR